MKARIETIKSACRVSGYGKFGDNFFVKFLRYFEQHQMSELAEEKKSERKKQIYLQGCRLNEAIDMWAIVWRVVEWYVYVSMWPATRDPSLVLYRYNDMKYL